MYKYGVSSIKLPEYLVLKKPVIEASHGSDVVVDAKCGLVVAPEDPLELVKGIRKFRDLSQTEIKAMAQNGFDFVMANFVYETTVLKLVSFLERPSNTTMPP